MGSHSPREDEAPQHELSPLDTQSAALPYLSFTICLMSWSAMTCPPRLVPRAGCSGRAAGAALGHREIPEADRGRLVLEVVVQMVDLPLDPIRVLDPELVLVGVTAVHAHLLAHRQPPRLHAAQLRRHALRRVDLDADVVHDALARRTAARQGQVDRRPLGKELRVARLLLDRGAAEERLVELPALGQVRHVHVQMDLRAHSGSSSRELGGGLRPPSEPPPRNRLRRRSRRSKQNAHRVRYFSWPCDVYSDRLLATG